MQRVHRVNILRKRISSVDVRKCWEFMLGHKGSKYSTSNPVCDQQSSTADVSNV